MADRFVRRFGETLDFRVVYREMFVRDAKLRHRDIELLTDGLLAKPFRGRLDHRTSAETYLAFMSTFYVGWLFELNVRDVYHKEPAEYLPRDVLREAKKTPFGRCILHLDPNCETMDEEGFKTRRELNEFLRLSRRVSNLLRRHMPKRPFESHSYKTNVREIVWNNQTPEVFDGDGAFEIANGTPVYQIARGMFLFRIVNEKGKLRVLSLIFAN